MEKRFEKVLKTHPELSDETEWPHLIAQDSAVGPTFCLDSYADQSGAVGIALGAGSGEVRFSGWVHLVLSRFLFPDLRSKPHATKLRHELCTFFVFLTHASWRSDTK